MKGKYTSSSHVALHFRSLQFYPGKDEKARKVFIYLLRIQIVFNEQPIRGFTSQNSNSILEAGVMIERRLLSGVACRVSTKRIMGIKGKVVIVQCVN